MIYRVKEKFWSLGNNFTITDEGGHNAYRVSGKAFSWGDKLSFQDMEGKELAFIKQKMMSLMPRYQILKRDTIFAEVTKQFSWLKKKFVLDVPGPNDYLIEGSFWAHEFEFKRGAKIVATISKKHWGWTDSYGVKIIDDEDDVAILSTCIVIDQVLHDGD